MELPARLSHPLKLTRAKEFEAALTAACRVSGRHFLVRAVVNQLPAARLGLIASRKAARRAVDRNRAKRLARATFLALRPGLPPLDIVLQLRNDLRQSKNPEIRAELVRLITGAAARFGTVPVA